MVLFGFSMASARFVLQPAGAASAARRPAKLTTAQITAALKRARRRDAAGKAKAIQAALRAAHLGQPAVVAATTAVLTVLNEQIKTLEQRPAMYLA